MKRMKQLGIILFIAVMYLFIQPEKVHADGIYKDFTYTVDRDTKEITITGYTGTGTYIMIPAQINGYYVTTIAQGVFKQQPLVTVEFEAGSRLTTILWAAFSDCTSLKNIVLPDTVRIIADSVFCNCKSLESITIPEGVTCFNKNISSSASVLGGVFEGCSSLKTVKLPSTFTAFREKLFKDCISLKEIAVPTGLVDLGTNTFQGSGITHITIPAGVSEIPYECFKDCKSLEIVKMSDHVNFFDSGSFTNCSKLRSINIPTGLKRIYSSCFEGCTSLTELKFGEDVFQIGNNIFNKCPNLTVHVVRGSEMEVYCMNNAIRYKVYASSISGCNISGIVEKKYDGKAKTQKLLVTCGSDTLILDQDYTVAYSNNINVGTAEILITGIGNYSGQIKKTFRIIPENINKCTIKVSKKTMTYIAKRLEPSVTVTYKGKKISSNNYRVYYSNNLYVGTAGITLTGLGNFTGTVNTVFSIVPKSVSIKSLISKNKGFSITYTANNIQTSGYQIQYATNSQFTSRVVSKRISSGVTSFSLNQLKSRTKYYVRVRTYKTISGKNYYSNWSKVKSVTTK